MYRDAALIARMIKESKTIAVVGVSDRPDRPSNEVARYLEQFYEVIPVNPNLESWGGKVCYPTLESIPHSIKIDLVDVFRRSADVLPVVEQAIARPIPFIWLQQGIYNAEAARLAEAASIGIVMDACLLVEHAKTRHS
ncbi:MAG: CoA-binding protein [Deltaproteobacteria bacterium]|nr:CoA-binding protein [Deltaproteobacteria bacterium]